MTLSQKVKIAQRFQRAIRIDSDIGSADALDGYISNRTAVDALNTMVDQIGNSSQRAFTWTGPYGGGKSSLALALASLLGPAGASRESATRALGKAVSDRVLEGLHPTRTGWLVVPVVGRRGDPVADIGSNFEQLRRAAKGNQGRRRHDAATGRELVDRLVAEADEHPRDGVVIIVDEMGKYLEAAARGECDLHFFQDLAEAASRSKGRLIFVGILHQAFDRYAARLGADARDEWTKIQGRFSDIPIVAAIDEVVELLGNAIVSDAPQPVAAKVCKVVADAIRARRGRAPADLADRLKKCVPLHPVTALLLGPMSRRRFGQNERSIFGFLNSAEPGGFQEFLRDAAEGALFGADRLWDFLKANLEPAILVSSDSHRWALATDAIERCESRASLLHLRLIKVIAMIELFRNGSGLAAERAVLASCVADQEADLDRALEELARWSIVIYRKHLNAWGLFAGSDFDIDAALSGARATLGPLDAHRLAGLAGMQAVLAKRHYHQTGTLRWFKCQVLRISDLDSMLAADGGAAGLFVLALPEVGETRRAALTACRNASQTFGEKKRLVAIGLPAGESRIRDLATELHALEAAKAAHPELEGDPVAKREIAARLASVMAELEEEIRSAFSMADWYRDGERLETSSLASLSQLASQLLDDHFKKAPHIFSELANRERPGANTQAGIRDLMHAMVRLPDKAQLGIEGFPIERGLYETLLRAGGLHREVEGRIGFANPDSRRGGLHHAWKVAEKLFSDSDSIVTFAAVFADWAKAPLGIRRGVMPVLALAFVVANRDRYAIYCEGRFQADLDDFFVDLLLQDETKVALRRVDIDAYRTAVLEGIAKSAAKVLGERCETQPLELARQLVRFARKLPEWTRRTLSLTDSTAEVRRVLLHADDPNKALFIDLPVVLAADDPRKLAIALNEALLELSEAYQKMMEGLREKLMQALGAKGSNPSAEIRRRASTVAGLTGNLRLDAVAARFAEYSGAVSDIESIAALALEKPVREWSDRDPDQAGLALAEIALAFRRAETLARVKGRAPTREAMAVIFGTGEAGSEVVREFDVDAHDRVEIDRLKDQLAAVLSRCGASRNVVLAALAETGVTAAKPRDKVQAHV